MPITIDLPPAMVQEAKAYAHRKDMTLDGMILSYLKSVIASETSSSTCDPAEEFARLAASKGVRLSHPYKFRRADAYEGESLA